MNVKHCSPLYLSVHCHSTITSVSIVTHGPQPQHCSSGHSGASVRNQLWHVGITKCSNVTCHHDMTHGAD